jgi:[glutamine synthetase] adenylyltransferase / [glutamine synthetase]-adenylyl-L-tyrosine phosphorylase
LKQQYKLSDSFISGIFKTAGGYLQPEDLDRFLDSLESEIKNHFFTKSSENNLLRVIQSFFDKTSLIKDSIKYPHYTGILITAAVNSNYVCDILVRDPEFFYWIANPSNLSANPGTAELKKNISELTSHYKTFSSRLNSLKSFKRKEIFRTGIQDLLGILQLQEITKKLSSLASSILDILFQLCYKEIQKKYGYDFTNSYCVISLGKLGGEELNYSSDTDLIIFYDKDKKYGSRYYSEYLTEAIKLFIDSSSRLTDSGYLYRIDLRLRPDGKNSPLCRSINEYLSYYESRGEAWERQMLIKSDFLSGNEKLYGKFKSYLTPFIYPSTMTISPAEEVKRLKSAIEKNLRSELNIKLARGGIRDIEFAVQVLQLLNGGKDQTLRQNNTIAAIENLSHNNFISSEEKDVLLSSYIFFRKIEHYLQLMNDRQVHTIPEAGEVVNKMAAFLGFENRDSFIYHLNQLRSGVRNFYDSVTGKDDIETITNIFRNPPQASRDLEYLREGKELTGNKSFDQQTQKAFLKIEPFLFKMLKQSEDPDTALSRMVYVLKTSGYPSIWYHEFNDEVFLGDFLKICSNSSKAINLIGTDPEINDFLLGKKFLQQFSEEEIKLFSLNKLLFYLASRIALNIIEPDEFSRTLNLYFKNKINSLAAGIPKPQDFLIAAMGSFGSGEMTFSSDLDLIFVVNKSSAAAEKRFRGLLAEINSELRPFKGDCRLRPEGEGSQLVWELESYQKYIASRARIWELQALTKMSFISGNKEILSSIILSAENRLKKENCTAIKTEILEMRKKITDSPIAVYSRQFDIKKSPGGITDIEFILQYLILCSTELFSRCRAKNISDTIDILTGFNEEYRNLSPLKNNSIFFRKIKLAVQSAFDVNKTIYPADDEKKKLIASIIGISTKEMDSRFNEAGIINKQIFEKYFE